MLASLLALSLTASAGELAGVVLPDSITLGGQPLILNGMGLREKYFIDVYVGGLYLPQPARSADAVIRADVPKRMVMHFIYHHVTREQMLETFQEGMRLNPATSSMGDRVERLYALMQDVNAGDQVTIDYVPGVGTKVNLAGRSQDTIPGADFMQAVWTLFIGPNPPSEKLKAGLLGGAP